MNIAIFLVGNIRTWDRCKESFISSFTNLNSDIFISTYTTQYAYHPYIQQTTNFYDEISLSYDQVGYKFHGMNIRSIVIDDIDEYVNKVKTKISKRYSEGLPHHTFSQYFKINDCVNELLKIECETKTTYDIIIKTRFDIKYNEKCISQALTNLGESVLYIDSGNVFPSDWILISNRKNFLSLNNSIISEITDMKTETSTKDVPHGMLANAIRASNLTCRTEKFVSTIERRS